MKRSTGEYASRVYSYGTVPLRLAPVAGEDRANDQLRLANRLWNTLVALDRARTARYQKIMRDEVQERIEALKQQIDDVRKSMDAKRKAARKRKVDLTEEKAVLEQLRAERNALIQAQKDSSEARHAARREALDALGARHMKRIIRARQAAASMGLFWGTYNDVIQRADTARKSGKLQFHRFAGDGTLTAQIMGGAPVARCVSRDGRVAAHTFFQVDPPAMEFRGRPGRMPADLRWRHARMRIGSDGIKPVWLDIPIVYHREIPSPAIIKSVSMTRRRGVWQLNITVNVPHPEPRVGPAMAVDVGWRLLPGGVRVGYWCDDDGAHGQLLVGDKLIAHLTKVSELRSTCDNLQNEYQPALAAWLDGQQLPEEWQRQTSHLIQWRSGDRLAGLLRWWADHRLDGDEEIYTAGREWRKQYLHLARWWRALEDQTRLAIREQYRLFADRIAGRYGTLFLEDFDLRRVAETPAPESEEITTASSRIRQMVSPSVFRAALINACKREGVRIVKLAAAYTTKTCATCGHVDDWNQAAELIHRCTKCDKLFDQDFNAARNLLQLGHASAEAPPTENQPDSGPNQAPPEDRSQSSPQASGSMGDILGAAEVPARGLGT